MRRGRFPLAAALLVAAWALPVLASPTSADQVPPTVQSARDADRDRILEAESVRLRQALDASTRRIGERRQAGDLVGQADAERARQRILADMAALQRERSRHATATPAHGVAADRALPPSPSAAWWDVYARPVAQPIDDEPGAVLSPSVVPAATAPAVRIP